MQLLQGRCHLGCLMAYPLLPRIAQRVWVRPAQGQHAPAGLCCALPNSSAHPQHHASRATCSPPRVQGYLFGLLSALLSAVAAVYTEWIMKSNNDSLYWQNCLLYGFGVAFNGVGLTFSGGKGPNLGIFNPKTMFSGEPLGGAVNSYRLARLATGGEGWNLGGAPGCGRGTGGRGHIYILVHALAHKRICDPYTVHLGVGFPCSSLLS
jgi:hypothetical protein